MKNFEDQKIKSLQDFNNEIPAWIDQEITVGQVRAIMQDGCASGAYMPAVTYHEALKIMNEHGDDILEHADDLGIEFGSEILGLSWSGMACHLLSSAVESWACSVANDLDNIETDFEDEVTL